MATNLLTHCDTTERPSICVTSATLKAMKSHQMKIIMVRLLDSKCTRQYNDRFWYGINVEIAEFHVCILGTETQTVCQMDQLHYEQFSKYWNLKSDTSTMECDTFTVRSTILLSLIPSCKFGFIFVAPVKGIVITLQAERPRNWRSISGRSTILFSFSPESRPVLGPSQPHIQLVTGDISLGV
jgi:hypothetical protein